MPDNVRNALFGGLRTRGKENQLTAITRRVERPRTGRVGQGRRWQIHKAKSCFKLLYFMQLARSNMQIYSGVTNTAKEDLEIRIRIFEF